MTEKSSFVQNLCHRHIAFEIYYRLETRKLDRGRNIHPAQVACEKTSNINQKSNYLLDTIEDDNYDSRFKRM